MPPVSRPRVEGRRPAVPAAGRWEWDAATRSISADRRLRRLVDPAGDGALTPERLLRRIHPEDRPRAIAEATRIAATPGPFSCTLRLVDADGAARWIEVRGRGVADGGGRPARLRGEAHALADAAPAPAPEPPELARFFDLSVDLLAVVSLGEGRWRRVNPAFTATLGWSAAEVLAMPLFALTHPDDLERSRAAAAELLRGRALRRFEHRMRCKDGSYTWIAWNTAPDVGTGVIYCVGHDITAQRAAEEALRASEATLSAVLDAIPVGVAIADPGGRLVRFTDAFRRIWGGYRETASVDAYDQWVATWAATGERVAAHEWAMARALRGEVVVDDLMEIEPVDGGPPRLLLNHAAPVRDASGAIIAAVTVGVDVTAQRQGERALADAQRRLQAALHGARIATWVLELADERVLSDHNLAPLLGLADAGEGLPLAAYLGALHPDDRGAVREGLAHAIASGDDFIAEARLNADADADTPPRWIYARGRVERDGDGRPVRLAGVVMDVSERKRTEEALQRAQRMESIGVLAGGVAHDFNNLLTGVLGHADLALHGLPPGAPAAEHLRQVLGAGQRAAELTRQLLAYAGKGRYVVARLDLADTVREMKDLVHASVSRAIAVELDLDDAPLPVIADGSQLQQLVMNLVLNAAEAIGDRHGRIRIAARRRELGRDQLRARYPDHELRPGTYVELIVEDDGCGMDAAVRARIFDPFFTTKFMGRGLGLAAALGIVRGHAGGIAVESAPGVGTTFRLVLPLAVGPGGEAPAADERDLGGREAVLVVDDEAVIREAARDVLAAAGYRVELAVDGADALARLRAAPDRFDLVVLDLTMPGLGGAEVLAALRDLRPRPRVVLTSGYGESEAVGRLPAGAIAGFLQKPWTGRRLLAAARAALDAG